MLLSVCEEGKQGLTSTIFRPSGTDTKFITNSIFHPRWTKNNGLPVIFHLPVEKDWTVPWSIGLSVTGFTGNPQNDHKNWYKRLRTALHQCRHKDNSRRHDASNQSCAPTNWWSAAALGGLMTGGGGTPRIFHRRHRRGFMVGVGVRPDERALKQRTRWTGVFSWFYRGQPVYLWSPLGC